jgi:ATP-dependent helicase Lhr and Lhr-like helicase
VTSDGYPALRTLLRVKAQSTRGRRHRSSQQSMPQPVGRWTLLRSPLLAPIDDDRRTEEWCRLLLRRYGVMFRDLIANESSAPRWGVLVWTYRRLEARGEIRGGRFVSGVAGEQYALPEAIALLRSSDHSNSSTLILPATDPLNLTGRIGNGTRVPALPGHSIAISNGHLKLSDSAGRLEVALAALPRSPCENHVAVN